MRGLSSRQGESPARRPAKQQWHAPESRPLQLGGRSPMERAGTPRAIVAGVGLMALLALGATAAVLVDQTATLQADAGGMPATSPETAVEPREAAAAPAPATPAPSPAEDTTTTAAAEPASPKPSTPPPAAAEPTVAVAEPPAAAPADAREAGPTAPDAPVEAVPFPDLSERLGLRHDDPRWARAALAETPPALTALESQQSDGGATAFQEEPPPTAALARFAGDEMPTAGIPADLVTHGIPVPTARPGDVEVTAEADSPGGRQARVRSAVNLRSRPADEASVLAVVPANSKVSLLGCKSWCEIVFQNRRGFVYKNFVR
ncbi:MAG: SH3 domain-containing protein [Mesorhizobium sp.]